MAKVHRIIQKEKDFENNFSKSDPIITTKFGNLKKDFRYDGQFDNFPESDFISKKFSDDKKSFFRIDEDINLSISGCGSIFLFVEKDCRIVLGYGNENTNLSIFLILSEGINVNLLEKTSARSNKSLNTLITKNSTLNFNILSYSGNISFYNNYLEENSNLLLSSFYSFNGDDVYMKFNSNHIGLNSSSDMKIFGFANESSKVICDGLVKIEQEAKKSIGYQKIGGIMVDKSSSIISEPILEIKNNDVKCSHGASISRLADDVLFYLNSRGLSNEVILDLLESSYSQVLLEDFLDLMK